MDGIMLQLLGEIGPAALVTLAVLMIYTGGLVPKKSHEETVKERDVWRAHALELQKQNTLLISSGEVTAKVLTALPLQTRESDR